MKFKKPPLRPQVTTLWDYPSQHYGEGVQGDPNYKGATPSYIIWNLLKRYTKENDLVVDCFAGSGTTLDVARDLGRRALGYDVHPTRKDIFRVDARKLPPELTGKVDFVFIDPPYSTHLDYGDDPRDIGKLDAAGGEYYPAMDKVFAEIHRMLKPGKHMGLYVSDSFVKGKGFFPIGFELFARLLDVIKNEVTRVTFNVQIQSPEELEQASEEIEEGLSHLENVQYKHDEFAEGREPVEEAPSQRTGTAMAAAELALAGMPKVGRNDPCPCGSGKKFKLCHGKLA